MRFMLSYAFALLFSMFSFQFEELLKHFCKAGLVVMSYLSFCLSGKDSISHSFSVFPYLDIFEEYTPVTF